jgi:hypothetical protein
LKARGERGESEQRKREQERKKDGDGGMESEGPKGERGYGCVRIKRKPDASSHLPVHRLC